MVVAAASANDQFVGSYLHGLDSSRRIMFPKAWRPDKWRQPFSFIPWPIGADRYLLALPPQRYAALVEHLLTRSLSDEDAASIERVIAGDTVKLILDRFGRLCLPEELARRAGIAGAGRFVGRFNVFELWAPGRLEAVSTDDRRVAAAAVKNYML
jgi:DNA-binding transcriptional regulator/RsmH inhibitor MraZ